MSAVITQEQIKQVLEDDGDPMTCREIAAMLDTEDLLGLNNMLLAMQQDKEVRVTFNDEQIRQYSLPEESPATDERPVSKSPLAALRPVEVEDLILAAIDTQHCTLPQIKRHAGFDPWDDISEAIYELLATKDKSREIVKESNGTATAFFRKGRIPKRWWLDGDTIGADWGDTAAEEQRKRELMEQKQREVDERNEAKARADAEASVKLGSDAQAAERSTVEDPAPAAVKTTRAGKTQRIDLTEDQVEAAYAEHGKMKAVAKALDIGYSTLYTKLGGSDLLKAAAERGRKIYAEKNANAGRPGRYGKVKTKLSRAEAVKVVILPESFREFAAKGCSPADMAAVFGISENTIRNRREKPENKKAWNDGDREFRAGRYEKNWEKEPETAEEKMLLNMETESEPVIPEASATSNQEAVDETTTENSVEAVEETGAADTSIQHNLDRGRDEYERLTKRIPVDDTAEAPELLEKPLPLEEPIGRFKLKKQTEPGAAENVAAASRHIENILKALERLDAQKRHVHHEYITFADGSQLLVAFEGNVFKLSNHDRAVLEHVTQLVQRYESDTPAVEGKPTLWQRFRRAIG